MAAATNTSAAGAPAAPNVGGSGRPCLLLSRLPPEIRKFIYELLLTSPVLASTGPFNQVRPSAASDAAGAGNDTDNADDADATDYSGAADAAGAAGAAVAADGSVAADASDASDGFDSDPDEEEEDYLESPQIVNPDLWPAILRTCRQIYQEGTRILYGSNTFGLWIFRNRLGHSHILNGTYEDCLFPRDYDTDVVPAFKRIQNWKVVMSPKAYENRFSPPVGLDNFCRALCDSDVKSLEICIVRVKKKKDDKTRTFPEHSLAPALMPLETLRNLSKLEIIEINKYNKVVHLPDYPMKGVFWVHDFGPTSHFASVSKLEKARLQELAQGNSPIFHAFKANKKLLAYAAAFERSDKHRQYMKPLYGVARSTYDSNYFQLGESNLKKELCDQPVERALALALISSREDNEPWFRDCRAAVIKLLEPQYQRMVAATVAMAEFADTWKTIALKRGAHTKYDKPTCQMAKALLDLYADSFKRDMLEGTLTNIRAHYQAEYDQAYADLPRESFLSKMVAAEKNLESAECRKRYMSMFRRAVDDMHDQYLRICRARRALFAHDIEDPECDIDLKLEHPDVMIDWYIPTPQAHLDTSSTEEYIAADTGVIFDPFAPNIDPSTLYQFGTSQKQDTETRNVETDKAGTDAGRVTNGTRGSMAEDNILTQMGDTHKTEDGGAEGGSIGDEADKDISDTNVSNVHTKKRPIIAIML